MIMKICDTVFIMPNNAHAVLSRLVMSLSHVTLCDPMDCSPQAPLSMGFSRQEYWSGCHALLQGIFLTQGLNPNLLHWKQVLDHLSCRGSPTMHIFCHKSLSYLLGTFLDCINEHKHFKDTYYIYIYIYTIKFLSRALSTLQPTKKARNVHFNWISLDWKLSVFNWLLTRYAK